MAIRSILSLLLSGVLPLVYCDPQGKLALDDTRFVICIGGNNMLI